MRVYGQKVLALIVKYSCAVKPKKYRNVLYLNINDASFWSFEADHYNYQE